MGFTIEHFRVCCFHKTITKKKDFNVDCFLEVHLCNTIHLSFKYFPYGSGHSAFELHEHINPFYVIWEDSKGLPSSTPMTRPQASQNSAYKWSKQPTHKKGLPPSSHCVNSLFINTIWYPLNGPHGLWMIPIICL